MVYMLDCQPGAPVAGAQLPLPFRSVQADHLGDNIFLEKMLATRDRFTPRRLLDPYTSVDNHSRTPIETKVLLLKQNHQ